MFSKINNIRKAEEKNSRIIRVDGRRMISLPLSTLNCIKC